MTFMEAMNKKHGMSITSAMQKELDRFDPKALYGGKYENLRMSQTTHKILVGRASDLIWDMTVTGASEEEFVRMLKYGTVLIDTVKHGLDYERAAEDFGFWEIYKKYHKSHR